MDQTTQERPAAEEIVESRALSANARVELWRKPGLKREAVRVIVTAPDGGEEVVLSHPAKDPGNARRLMREVILAAGRDHLRASRRERAATQLAQHDFGDDEWRRVGPWRWTTEDMAVADLARTLAHGEDAAMPASPAVGSYHVLFAKGSTVVMTAVAEVGGRALGDPGSPDQDVTDDDAYDGNDAQIEDLKDRVGDLRRLLGDGPSGACLADRREADPEEVRRLRADLFDAQVALGCVEAEQPGVAERAHARFSARVAAELGGMAAPGQEV